MSTSIRPGTLADLPCLHETFWRHYHDTPYGRATPQKILSLKLEALLGAPGWSFEVLCESETPEEILGLIVYRPPTTNTPVPTLGWVYVKDIYRHHGYARQLLTHAGIKGGEVHCAFVDPKMAQLAATKGLRVRFRPYLPDVAAWDTLRRGP